MNIEKRESYLRRPQNKKEINTKTRTFKKEMPDWKITKIITVLKNWLAIKIYYILEDDWDEKNKN